MDERAAEVEAGVAAEPPADNGEREVDELDAMVLSARQPGLCLLGDDFVAAEKLIKTTTRDKSRELKSTVDNVTSKLRTMFRHLFHETHAQVKMQCAHKYPDTRAILQIVEEHLSRAEAGMLEARRASFSLSFACDCVSSACCVQSLGGAFPVSPLC